MQAQTGYLPSINIDAFARNTTPFEDLGSQEAQELVRRRPVVRCRPGTAVVKTL